MPIPINEIVREGLIVTAIPTEVADASNGNTVEGNDGTIFLEVISTDGSAQTVTVAANPALTADGLTIMPLVLTIAAGDTSWFGPFRPSTFNQDTVDNALALTPSVSGTLEFRVYKLTAARI